MEIARDRYPDFTYWLAERTGIDVPVNRDGIIEIIDSTNAFGSGSSSFATATPLDAAEVRSLEPGLATGFGGLLHPLDGFVDNVRLLEAMRECARCEWAIDVIHARASRIVCGRQGCSILTEDGREHVGGAVVVAAGAWSPLVDGLPRPLHVEPVRGQMLRLHGAPLRHAVSAPDGYLVPRGDTTLVGSTLERVGFDSTTTPTTLARLRAAAAALCPTLADGAVVDAWAGLRPMTPDGLPLIGQDPEVPWLVYACGHGKNGILLAPLTGECVAALVGGSVPPVELAPFSVDRFE